MSIKKLLRILNPTTAAAVPLPLTREAKKSDYYMRFSIAEETCFLKGKFIKTRKVFDGLIDN